MTSRCGYVGSAVLVGTGLALTVLEFDADDPWFYVGLATALVGMMLLNTTAALRSTRSMDHEFDTGYRVGYRAGRRAPISSAKKGRGTVTRLDHRRRA